MTGPLIRRATAADVDALAAYITRVNAAPERQCLHTPSGGTRVVRDALLRENGLASGVQPFFILERNGGIMAAVGCQFDAEKKMGWLWGPWTTGFGWKTDAPALLQTLLDELPPRVRRLDAFLNIENVEGLGFLRQHGFSIRPATHIYVAVLDPGRATATDALYPALSARYEVGFAQLHRETFPAAESASAEELLAGRNDERVIFAAADDLRLLGYVCVSINAAPVEGFIDYLAVRPAARGRGIGQRLLQTALQWIFAARALPQAALCVTEWRADARRLYERAGFRLSATGRGARRELR